MHFRLSLWDLPKVLLIMVALLGFGNAVSAALEPFNPFTGTVERVTLANDGTQGNNDSHLPVPSADGEVIAFWSEANNLVPNDTNGYPDVFVRDRAAGTTERVSVNSDGTEGDAHYYMYGFYAPRISADGNVVAFTSYFINLVSGDTNDANDVFVRDRDSNTTTRISIATDGSQGDAESDSPSVSADGRYVAFRSYANNFAAGDGSGYPGPDYDSDVFVRDRTSNSTSLVSIDMSGVPGNGYSGEPSISGNGRYVVFASNASDLVPNDESGFPDIFLRDLQARETFKISVSNDGVPMEGSAAHPVISTDGRYVVYLSTDGNLTSPGLPTTDYSSRWLYLYDRINETTELVSLDGNENPLQALASFAPTVSSDGRYIGFMVRGYGYKNNQILVRDRQTNQTLAIGRSYDGSYPAHPDVNYPTFGHSNTFLGFDSPWDNLIPGDNNNSSDGFVVDVSLAKTPTPVPSSTATNTPPPTRTPVPTPTVALPGYETMRVSVSSLEQQADLESNLPSISGDGRYVAFISRATDLVPNDMNGYPDPYVRDTVAGETESLAFEVYAPPPATVDSTYNVVSRDGNHVAFITLAPLISDTNAFADVYYYNTQTRLVTLVSRDVAGWAVGVGSSWDTNLLDISDNGQYIVFATSAPNVVASDTNSQTDVFRFDTQNNMMERVSLGNDNGEGNGLSGAPAISGDGRYIAFHSLATNLVLSDTNAASDIFVRDVLSDTTTRISLNSIGDEANDGSRFPTFAKEGGVVVFNSLATNLVLSDTNGVRDVFVHDLATQSTERVSVGTGDVEADDTAHHLLAAISGDGRYVAFSTRATNLAPGDTNGTYDIYRHDRTAGQTELVSLDTENLPFVHRNVTLPDISDSGERVTFMADATVYYYPLTFLRDLPTSTTTRLDVNPYMEYGNQYSRYASLNGDGSIATFNGNSWNLLPGTRYGKWQIFQRDIDSNNLELVSRGNHYQTDNWSRDSVISGDGNTVAITTNADNFLPYQDLNFNEDVYLYERDTDTVIPVTVDDESDRLIGGDQPDLSSDGQAVVYRGSDGAIYHWNRTSNTRTLVASGGAYPNPFPTDYIGFPALSADGIWVAFQSSQPIVAGDNNNAVDIYLKNIQTSNVTRVSVASNGSQSNYASTMPAISADGRYIAFTSLADNFFPGDSFYSQDTFVHDRVTGMTMRVSVPADGSPLSSFASTYLPALSADGRFVAFHTDVALIPGDTNFITDVYWYDRQRGAIFLASTRHDSGLSDGFSANADLSADGRQAVYASYAMNLVPGDTNFVDDVFKTKHPPDYPPNTPTPTVTNTPTVTTTATPPPTFTPTTTVTASATQTATATVVPTSTATATLLPTQTATATPTIPPDTGAVLYLPLLQRQ